MTSDKPDPTGEDDVVKPWPVVGRSTWNVQPGAPAASRPSPGIDYDEGAKAGLQRRYGPGGHRAGTLLRLVGLVVAAYGFIGWVAIVVRLLRSESVADLWGPVLPSGLSVGVVYLIAFGVGVLLTALSWMVRSGWHLVWVVLAVALIAGLVVVVLGGEPAGVLLPRFSLGA